MHRALCGAARRIVPLRLAVMTKINTRRWKRVRQVVLSFEPLCRICMSHGRVTAASEVDHIVPRSEGGDLYDRSNLQPLCQPCHFDKTARENSTPNKGACVHGVPHTHRCPICHPPGTQSH